MLSFTLPIEPKSQARPKITVRNGFAHGYKTRDQEANERTMEAWLKEHVPAAPMAGPLVLEFIAALPVPRSVSRKRKDDMLRGQEFPAKRPDLDNLAKQLKDAMGRMGFWGDDRQIVSLYCDKIYAESGYWQVCVYDAVRK